MPRVRTIRRVRRIVIALGLVIAFFGALAIVVAWHASGQSPSWWRQINPRDPEVVATAETIENAVVNELHRADRPAAAVDDGRWRTASWGFAITSADANAWLNTRLRRWLENRVDGFDWPIEIEEVQTDFNDNAISIGVKIRDEDDVRWLSARLEPRIDETGALWLEADRVYTGRLAIPTDWVLEQVRSRVEGALAEDDDAAALFKALAGETPIMREPVVDLGDGRIVRLLSLTPRRGRLEVICRTEAD